MNPNQLKQAAHDGVISDEQLKQLENYSNTSTGENSLRFLSRFSDIFISVGIILVAWIGLFLVEKTFWGYSLMIVLFIAMSEWLVGRRHLTLPGMTLLIHLGLFSVCLLKYISPDIATGQMFLISFVATLFYLRYKLPFSLFVIAWAMVFELSSLIWMVFFDGFLLSQLFSEYLLMIILPMGLIVFACAAYLDSRDTKRQSYLSDGAFWLHIAAAPMIVHPVMIALINLGDAISLWVMGGFILFFLNIALILDRRAMILSSILYGLGLTLYVYFTTVDNFFENALYVFYILLVMSFLTIILGVYWYEVRTRLYHFISHTALATHLPKFTTTPYV